ncbi:DUF948 domain-containing protein [Actinomadura decatromicini]|uniref:DUF948 domain-containing protein n=1 Tax=Actinomadura decatromicini TaxID=2604572 RepID=A0A5D3F3K6_9ACTN|nr:DUF948 domain-containing protein [Actinomadura decatromicini]TYK42891.1 DUF948 domain-containing protein [Actinomadura decatromicini]
MLTGGQLAGLIVAVFWAVLVSFIALTLLRLSRLLAEAGRVVREIGDQAAPLLDDMSRTVRRADEQLGRTDVITKQVAGVTQNVSAVTTVMTSVVGGPLVKAAAFSYGVRKALASGGRDGEARVETRAEGRAAAPSRPQLQAGPESRRRSRPTRRGRR